MVRILLVDDQRFIRESLKAIFESEPSIQVVGTAGDGSTAIEQVEFLKPDIVIMDLSMPQMSGMDAMHIINQRFPAVKVLVFSTHNDQNVIDQALKKGASGYLLKSSSHFEIKQAVQMVGEGKTLFSSPDDDSEFELAQHSMQIVKAETILPTTSKLDHLPTEIPEAQRVSAQLAIQSQQPQHGPIISQNDLATLSEDSIIESQLLTSPQTTWKQYLGFGVTLSVLLAGISTVVYRQGIEPSQSLAVSPTAQPLPVEALELTPVSSLEIPRSYVGEISPKRKSALSFDKVGRVTQVLVKAGDVVVAGQPLAYLDSQSVDLQKQDLQAQRAQAVARLEELKAGPRAENVAAAQASVKTIQEQLDLALLKRDRRNELHQAGAISLEQFNDASTEVGRLQAMIEEAQSRVNELRAGTRPESISAQEAAIASIDARINNLQLEQRNSVLKAPFSGLVSERLINEGTVVSPGQPLLQLVEAGEVEATVGVPSQVARTLTKGDAYPLQIDDVQYSATVRDVLPELDSNTLTQKVIFTVSGSQANQLPSNQIVRLTLNKTVKTSGFWVPVVALTKGNRGLWSCFVLENQPSGSKFNSAQTSKLIKQDVEILHTESDRALVRGTLKPGDRIAASGVHRLVPGQLVIISKQQPTDQS